MSKPLSSKARCTMIDELLSGVMSTAGYRRLASTYLIALLDRPLTKEHEDLFDKADRKLNRFRGEIRKVIRDSVRASMMPLFDDFEAVLEADCMRIMEDAMCDYLRQLSRDVDADTDPEVFTAAEADLDRLMLEAHEGSHNHFILRGMDDEIKGTCEAIVDHLVHNGIMRVGSNFNFGQIDNNLGDAAERLWEERKPSSDEETSDACQS